MVYLKDIRIPKDIYITLTPKNIIIKGPKGIISHSILTIFDLTLKEDILVIGIDKLDEKITSIYGLFRTTIINIIYGVKYGYSKTLIMEGIGYKFSLNNNSILKLDIGLTHPTFIKIPTDIIISLESITKLTISSIYKQKVGYFASKIRYYGKPEPYNGKGIHFEFEKMKLKKGKRS